MNAYTKIHIPTKNEVMEDMIAICKAIADSLLTPKPADDIKAIFVESNNGDLEIYSALAIQLKCIVKTGIL